MRRPLGLLVLVALGCTPEKPPLVPARPIVAPPTAVLPPVSRWVLLEPPKTAPRPHRKGLLTVGPLGERWWREGTAYAHAGSFAGAPLVGVVEHGGKLGFVEDDGSVRVADEPLGPFVLRRSPPTPLHAVAVGKVAILGIDGRGHVLRSVDAGTSWSDAGIGTKDAPIAVDLELDQDGKGRVLLAPTSGLVTNDDGATFAPDKGAAIDRLEPSHTRWSGHAALESELALDKTQLVRVHGEGEEAFLEARSLDGRDTPRLVAKFDDCRDAIVATRGARLAIGCTRRDDTTFVVLASEDSGKTFAPVLTLARTSMFRPRMWVSPEGSLLVERVCRLEEPKCASPLILAPKGEPAVAVQLASGRIDDLIDVAFVGGTVLGLGSFESGTKSSGGDAVFRSTDGGRTFVASPLPTVPPTPSPAPLNPVLVKQRWVRLISLGGPTERGNLAIDAQGRLRAVVFERQGRAHLFATADDGASFELRPAPSQSDLAFAGEHGLARDGHDVFVTHDAGASWAKLEEPGPWIDASNTVCSEAGCLSARGVVRLGWTGSTTPWKKPAPRPPQVASMFTCKATTTKSFNGYLSSAERVAVDVPVAPLRHAIAFEHASGDDHQAVTLAVDRGKGLQLEPLVLPMGAQSTSFHSHAGLVVRVAPPGATPNESPEDEAQLAWMTATGKLGRTAKKVRGAVVGLDGDGPFVRLDGKVHHVDTKGLGPPLGPDDDSSPFYARRGAELLRLQKGEQSVAVSKLVKTAFVEQPAFELWPVAGDEISLGLVGGAPAMWIDEAHRSGVLVRLLDKVDVRRVPPLDALAETICRAEHASWPRVLLPLLDGKHHGLKLELPDGPYWLGTSDVLVGVGPAGETCRQALRIEAPWETALGWLSLDEPSASVIVRAATKERIELHTVTCTASTDTLPAAAAGYHGY